MGLGKLFDSDISFTFSAHLVYVAIYLAGSSDSRKCNRVECPAVLLTRLIAKSEKFQDGKSGPKFNLKT